MKLGAVWSGLVARLDGTQPRQRRSGSALPDDAAFGKQGRTVYVRNQRLKAPQERNTSSNLADRGWVAVHARGGRATRWPGDVAGAEATMKICGVVVAKLQGHSWAPRLPNGWW
jgi:hypothetical protein